MAAWQQRENQRIIATVSTHGDGPVVGQSEVPQSRGQADERASSPGPEVECASDDDGKGNLHT